MDIVGECFVDHVEYICKSWWPARAIVEHAIQSRYDVHSSGSIMLLEKCCPWKVERVVTLDSRVYIIYLFIH
jgi:uncharacterized UPF0160 family protein